MEDNSQEMREELEQLDKDIERLKKDAEDVEDPMHLRGQGPAYYESGSERPTDDDQQITPG